MSLEFLLEIGAEEIPDWMIEPALENLKQLFSDFLAGARLGGEVLGVDATPRRLVLRAKGLAPSQPDETRLVSGPPVSSGEGAAQGFAKKNGVTLAELTQTETPKGKYWSYQQSVQGRPAASLLAEALPSIIQKIYFPKTMYWTGKGGPRFIRPIRWIVALLGDTVVNFELAGIRASNLTRGHRVLGRANVPVTIAGYESQLEQNGVILSSARRRARIEAGLDPHTNRDEALLKTLVYLTEFPTPIQGSFDPEYLELPGEILTTVMRHHQRYFTVSDPATGKMAPRFMAVMNTAGDPDGLVRKGNERVLRARFNDARFFWTVDLKRSLESRVADLEHVTFQAKLGHYRAKTERNVALARELAGLTGANADACARAALLLKCDLTTEMVKEFTELQGAVGGLYAARQGEPSEVWQAVYDHYRPTSMDDAIPTTLTGRVVALADKIDTLRGCFSVGMAPSGSKDPFALRRAAQGVVRILVEGAIRLPLPVIAAGDTALLEFLLDRVRYYFRDVRSFRYDEVNAAMAAGADDVVDLERRLGALKTVRGGENFEPLAASFKRIKNILRQANFAPQEGAVDESLLESGPEAGLYNEFVMVRRVVDKYRGSNNDLAALEAIASLRPKVDLFFDKVLVNAQDPAVRSNRLSLLSNLLTAFSAIADFSEIVTATENKEK